MYVAVEKMTLSGLLLIALQFGLMACTDLHLLALVPLGNMDKMRSCLNMGEELVPAAQIAADRINSNPHLLANFTLKIVPAGTDQCSDPSIARALGSFANFTTNKALSIVGIIGLVCPSALLSLSRIASLPDIDIVHITSSTTSPSIVSISRDEDIGRVYQTAPSSTVFNKAVVALMKKNSWGYISVIRHTESISVEHDYIASDFQERIRGESKLNISVYSETPSGLENFVQKVKLSGVRIIYASVTNLEARELICISYLNNVSWPNYVWLFHDYSVENLLYNTTRCSVETMEKALEGVVLLHHQVNNDSDRAVDHASYTYGEYRTMYSERVRNVTSHSVCNKVPQILSANALHDSVIAFAYALNKSLSESDIRCLGTFNKSCEATKRVDANLQLLNFSGAGGVISFDGMTHELVVDSRVNIYQVSNGTLSFLAQFDGTISENETRLSKISYTFERKIIRLPLALPVSTLVVIGLCTIVTLLTLIFFIRYRNSLDIKATSPMLSYVIIFSCFLLYTSVGVTAVRHGFASGVVYAGLCASEQFFFVLGVQLIFVTLFVRLLRVARIFFKYDPIGVAWSDKVLALYIGATVMVTLFLLVIWIAIGDFSSGRRESFIPSADPPHFAVHLSCSANKQPVFLSLVWGYTGIFMLLVMILAIKTRKVSIDIFKDTKSVNIFVFCSVGIFALFVPLSYITSTFTGKGNQILSYLFQVASVIVVAMACVSLLFIPKIYLALFAASRPHSKSVGNRASTGILPPKSSDGFSLQRTSAAKLSLP